MKLTKPGFEEPYKQIAKIRINLSSKHVKNVENVGSNLIHGAKCQELKVKGPLRMPAKVFKSQPERLLALKETIHETNLNCTSSSE